MALEIFKLVGSIFVNNDEANKSIAKTDKKAMGVGETLSKGAVKAAKWGTAIVGASVAVATGLYAVANKSAESADEIDKMSAKIGITKKAYQEWSYAMGQSGMDISTMQTGMKTLVANMDKAASGTQSSIDKFKALKISIEDGNGNMKDQTTIMNEAIMALAQMENGTEKARLATQLFGKAGSEMMPMLNGGAESIDELKKRANELGLVMSDSAVDAGVKFGDTMDDLKQSLGMLVVNLGSKAMPVMQKMADGLIGYMPQITNLFNTFAPIVMQLITGIVPPLADMAQNLFPMIANLLIQIAPIFVQLVQMVIPVLVELLTMLLPPLTELITQLLPPVLEVVRALMPLLMVAIQLLKPIINLFIALLPPIVAIIQGITPLIDVIAQLCIKLTNLLIPIITKVASVFTVVLGDALATVGKIVGNIMGVFQGLIDYIAGIFTGDWERAFQGLSTIVTNIFDAMVELIKTPLNWIIDGVNNFISGLNNVQVPDWVPAVGGKGINIPLIPELKDGGIPALGQLFVANEDPYAAPEMIGKFGSKTGVVNNQQIVEAVSAGVAQAVAAVMGTNKMDTKAIVKALESANLVAKVMDSDIASSVVRSDKKRKAQTGRGLVTS